MIHKGNLLLRSFGSKVTFRPSVTQLLINGRFVNSIDGKTFNTFNPATEEKIVDVQEAGKKDVDIAVQAARKAFDHGPWRRMAASERGRLIYKLSDLIEKHADELALLEVIDNGKPISFAKAVDIPQVINVFRYYAGWADKVHGQTIPIGGPYLCYTKEEPVGVVGQIIPWNYPALMMAWKIAPALAAGCTIVLKPAEQTPLSALRIGELIMEAGFPEGVVNILPGYGPTAGQALCQHPLVDKIAFTGSTEVGYEIMRNSHPHNIKRIQLELGGKSPFIVMNDADVDGAVEQAHFGLFGNQGQSCCACSRLFVQEKVYDEFVVKSVVAAKNRKVGDPQNPETDHGPQVDKEQFEKIMGYIKSGSEQGATISTGGKRWGDKGWFVEPTIISNVQDDHKVAKEEIFGPVMSVLKFKTVDEVIQRANNTQYGLAAGVMTRNIDKSIKVTNALQAGTVWVNCYDAGDANAPFGGFKDSGFGKDLGEAGLRGYLESKTVIIKRPDDSMP